MLKDAVESEGLNAAEAGKDYFANAGCLNGGRVTVAEMEGRAQNWKSLVKVPWSFFLSLAYLSDSFSFCLFSLSLMVVALKTSRMRGLGRYSRKM